MFGTFSEAEYRASVSVLASSVGQCIMVLSLLLSVVIVGVKALQIVVGVILLTEGCVRNYCTELVPFQ